MSHVFIGIDNGVSGSIGVVSPSRVELYQTPTFNELSYQKEARTFTRIDVVALMKLLRIVCGIAKEPDADGVVWFNPATEQHTPYSTHIVLERPMVNPGRFQATVSGLRAYEATLIAIKLGVPHAAVETVDSRAWQKVMLPVVKGAAELKKASLQRGCELFPALSGAIRIQKDADGLLMAEWARRTRA